jgi:Tol biopolymer transport system component
LGTASNAVYAEPGFLLFEQESTLMVRPFDAALRSFAGEPVQLADGFGPSTTNRIPLSVSATGLLSYQRGRQETEVAIFDRTGKRSYSLGVATENRLRLAPDGNRLAAAVLDPNNRAGDIWLFSLSPRGTSSSRLTSDAAFDWQPVWSPDGLSILFASNRKGAMSLYQRSLGQDEDRPVLVSPSGHPLLPTDWSRDGFLVYEQLDPATREDLWVLQLDGDRKPMPFLRTPSSETAGRLSPDGRWMAFVSDESGTDEIYVLPFAPTQEARSDGIIGKQRVSSNGGTQPKWRGDGTELFYHAANGTLMAVAVQTKTTFEADPPIALFATLPNWDVSADGQRVVAYALTQDSERSGITVLVNWTALLPKN